MGNRAVFNNVPLQWLVVASYVLDAHVRVDVFDFLQLILVQNQNAHVLRNVGRLLRYFAQLLLGQVQHRFVVAFRRVCDKSKMHTRDGVVNRHITCYVNPQSE